MKLVLDAFIKKLQEILDHIGAILAATKAIKGVLFSKDTFSGVLKEVDNPDNTPLQIRLQKVLDDVILSQNQSVANIGALLSARVKILGHS